MKEPNVSVRTGAASLQSRPREKEVPETGFVTTDAAILGNYPSLSTVSLSTGEIINNIDNDQLNDINQSLLEALQPGTDLPTKEVQRNEDKSAESASATSSSDDVSPHSEFSDSESADGSGNESEGYSPIDNVDGSTSPDASPVAKKHKSSAQCAQGSIDFLRGSQKLFTQSSLNERRKVYCPLTWSTVQVDQLGRCAQSCIAFLREINPAVGLLQALLQGSIEYSTIIAEEIEKQKAHERYMRQQEQGKTEQARKDLERLAMIRQQRAEAAKKRDEEKAGMLRTS
ncbi:hypothetical protein KSP40_PGU003539 [Platanthera guangdongensis]|uniref:Casein kinase substrate phosphoprotein PP28 domain-containing protein n=1 Tax=Platanthera guangdongensis TaxID=2320717 RepID=A0ABR2LK47_9ASPA